MDGFMMFKKALQKHFDEMQKEATHLFEVNVDKDELWNTYLDSFPAGTNEIFRERREHDCSCCRQFIKNIGSAVTIKDNQIHTIWELNLGDTTYQPVCDALDTFVKAHTVTDIYTTKFPKIGTDFNFEEINEKSHQWDHFFLELPNKFVNRSSRSNEEVKGQFRDTRNVFKRSLDEITMEALDTILELINSNTLYKGEEWKGVLAEFKKYKKEYDKLTSDTEKDLYAWEKSVTAGMAIGRIRNHSIGTLLINVSEDMDLDTAVKKYEQITAPSNYKRPKAIFTKKMLEDAKKTITELGYMDSLQRRFANLNDITVNNVLFSNKSAARRMVSADDIFGQMEKDVAVSPKKFSKVEEISAQDFINKVLPTAKEIEAFVENKHEKNFVSMIAPVNPDALYRKKDGTIKHYASVPKNKKTRHIPMQKDIEKLLQKYKNETYFISVSSNINIDGYTNFVFLNREEGLFTPNTLTRTCHLLRESCNKEEIEVAQWEEREPVLIPDFTFHVLRHTFCTRMAEDGMDVKVLQEIMGHSNIAVTMQVYNHVSDDRAINEMNKIQNVIGL